MQSVVRGALLFCLFARRSFSGSRLPRLPLHELKGQLVLTSSGKSTQGEKWSSRPGHSLPCNAEGTVLKRSHHSHIPHLSTKQHTHASSSEAAGGRGEEAAVRMYVPRPSLLRQHVCPGLLLLCCWFIRFTLTRLPPTHSTTGIHDDHDYQHVRRPSPPEVTGRARDVRQARRRAVQVRARSPKTTTTRRRRGLAPWTLNAQRPARFTQQHGTHHHEQHAGQ